MELIPSVILLFSPNTQGDPLLYYFFSVFRRRPSCDNKKRNTALILAAILMLDLAACSNSEYNDNGIWSEYATTTKNETEKDFSCFDNFRLPNLELDSCKESFYSADTITVFPPSGFFQKTFVVSTPENKQMKCETGGSAPTKESHTLKTLKIDSSTTIRCAEILNDSSLSTEIIRTYILEKAPTLPSIFITTDPNSLFDPDTGIYMEGPSAREEMPHRGANYWLDKEIPIFIELIEKDSASPAFAKYAGLEIFGNYSRAHPKKSVSITFRKKYGTSRLNYTLFPEFPELNRFKSLVLRNNGQNFPKDYIRDRLVTSNGESLGVDYQRGRFVIVYYNGRYFGIHDMRERSNEYYFETHYGMAPESINLLKAGNSVSAGTSDSYTSLMSWLEEHNLNNEKNYDYIASQIDINNFINYMQIEMFANNRDWPGNNLKKWNCTNPITPWKWFLYDTDQSFGSYGSGTTDNIFAYASAENSDKWMNAPASTLLFRSLLSNEKFRTTFINRMTTLLQTNFRKDFIHSKIEGLMKEISLEIPRDQRRWALDASKMNKHLDIIKNFAENRPAIIIKNLQEYFELKDVSPVTLSTNGNGTILIHGLPLKDFPTTIKFFEKLPVTITAKPQNGSTWTSWSDGEKNATRTIYPEKTKELTASFK